MGMPCSLSAATTGMPQVTSSKGCLFLQYG